MVRGIGEKPEKNGCSRNQGRTLVVQWLKLCVSACIKHELDPGLRAKILVPPHHVHLQKGNQREERIWDCRWSVTGRKYRVS